MSKDRQSRLFMPRTASVNLLTEAIDPTTPVEYSGEWSAEAVARLAVLSYPDPVRKRNMRVLVCGGRDYRDARQLDQELSVIRHTMGISVLIHGAARGADSLAGRWAKVRGIPVEDFPAEWYPDGKDGALDRSAGPKRNARMLAEGRPDLVVAFPGGDGTADMVERARATGVRVIEIKSTRS